MLTGLLDRNQDFVKGGSSWGKSEICHGPTTPLSHWIRQGACIILWHLPPPHWIRQWACIILWYTHTPHWIRQWACIILWAPPSPLDPPVSCITLWHLTSTASTSSELALPMPPPPFPNYFNNSAVLLSFEMDTSLMDMEPTEGMLMFDNIFCAMY